jgi:hypothetical protein
MNKTFSLGLILVFTASFTFSNTAHAIEGYDSYWDFFRSYHSTDNPRSSAFTPRYRTTNRTTFTPRRTFNSRTSANRSSNYRIYPTNRTSAATTSAVTQSGIKVTVNPITLRQNINNITAQPVSLFNIGVSNTAGSSSSFTPAALVSEMQFQITDNTGVVSDFSDFDLVVENQNFQFERNGYITLKFNNLRLARAESRNLEVQIKLNDPDTFARLPGSFRVKLSGVKATTENSISAINTSISGKTVSDYVVLNPVPSVSGGASDGTAASTPIFVEGKALGAGDRAVVLSAILKASLDDFLIEDITVRNAFGNNVDSLIQEIRLINRTTNQVVATKRFTNGEAEFNLSRNNQIFISRNQEANLVFEVLVRDNIPSSITDNRLELSFNESDIEIFGVGSGRAVPDSRKNFNLDAQTFTVTAGGGGGASTIGGLSFSASQPTFVSNGRLEQIARFQIQNLGSQGIEVGRISMQISPAGVEFSGGVSLDDAQIVRVDNGSRERDVGFNTVSSSGNKFVFDAGSRIYMAPGSVHEYALKLKIDNIGPLDDSDSVAIKILGDSSFSKGTLSSIRTSGANYIWSDLSASPHSTTSNDWYSGYLVRGLPTGNFIRNRR